MENRGYREPFYKRHPALTFMLTGILLAITAGTAAALLLPVAAGAYIGMAIVVGLPLLLAGGMYLESLGRQ